MRHQPDPEVDRVARDALVAVARATAQVERYCDHVEHAEDASAAVIEAAAAELIATATALAESRGVELQLQYARRLRHTEVLNPLFGPRSFDGASAVRRARTWRDLQLAQIAHDREYRPDVFGLSRASQLRRCCLHLAKLVGRLADEVDASNEAASEFDEKWLPDLFLMGIKLATVAGRNLPEAPITSRLSTSSWPNKTVPATVPRRSDFPESFQRSGTRIALSSSAN
jgi:hypothetical protein